ncbi:transmembrane emp24 domain-containing protein 5-like [Babylonia areolata]|uniref:transmembrane emp24 domain-containing protein 5-like n=1 Tax=Babylonia areolata TaxID=304850 RepID=UPI003FD60427
MSGAKKSVSTILTLWLLSMQMADFRAERIMGEERNDDFDFDGLPGTQHEFKLEVGGGMEECFYQRVAQGALMHVNFEVLQGGDRNLNVMIRDFRNQVVEGTYWKSDGIMEYTAPFEGTFSVCVDNTYSRFTHKLIYIFFMTYVLADWKAYIQEFDEVKNIAENLTHSMNNVELSLHQMKMSQTQARFNVIKDFYLVWGNNKYVQNWSLAQCLLIVAASVAQVFALRRMFRTTNVTPTAKPRA